MRIRVTRTKKTSDYTEGKVFINDEYLCDSLEDCDRNLTNKMTSTEVKGIKVYGETAIPTGRYKLVLDYSPAMAKKDWSKKWKCLVPHILDVSGFDGVRIHPGSSAKDSLGCILVGTKNADGKIVNSQAAYNRLMSYIAPSFENGQELEVIIE